MTGLSAKVFRTYNASVTLESELEILPVSAKESDKVGIIRYSGDNGGSRVCVCTLRACCYL